MNWNLISKYRTQLMGIACIWIMLFHNRFQWTGTSILRTFISRGNVGVDMFFFMSGVGLYYSFKKDPNVPRFYRKRLTRIMLPYTLYAVPFCIWRAHLKSSKHSFWAYFLEKVFVKNGITTTWFIPAILVCYIVFPLIYTLQNEAVTVKGRRIGRNHITLALLLIYFVFLRYVMSAHPTLWKHTEIALTRGLVFIIGCHCAEWIYEKKPLPEGSGLAGFLWIVVYLYFFRPENKLSTFWIRLSFIPFAVACLIFFSWLLLTLDTHTEMHRFRGLVFVGERTLELYLTHIMLRMIYDAYWDFPHFEKTGVIDYSIVLIGALILSAAGHWLTGKLLAKLSQKRPPRPVEGEGE